MRKSQVEQRRENENMMEAEKGEEHRRAVFFHYTISISVANVEIWSHGASGAGWVNFQKLVLFLARKCVGSIPRGFFSLNFLVPMRARLNDSEGELSFRSFRSFRLDL